ncbi:hypothetical protein V6238_12110 [Marinomonas arenicola]|jgi:hypothetical protein|uniref:hypothetical protein n=1 Tax=Marinomonas arenicola TaxID=569601 RepID=UPI00311D50E5
MSDTDSFKELIAAQHIEFKEQFAEQRRAMTKLVDSISELSSVLARSEERHLRHDDGVKRIGRVLDDHEIRIRKNESTNVTAVGGWKAITFIGSFVAAVITIALNYWGIK